MPWMLGAWEILERAGVPFGRHDARPDLADLASVARATRAVLAHPETLAERERVALLAGPRAWHGDRPTSFRKPFGTDGDPILQRTAEGEGDPGRYLKLRRIARETGGGALIPWSPYYGGSGGGSVAVAGATPAATAG